MSVVAMLCEIFLEQVHLEDSRRCVTWALTNYCSLCSCTLIRTSLNCTCITCLFQLISLLIEHDAVVFSDHHVRT